MSGIRYRSTLASRRSLVTLLMQGAVWAFGGYAHGQDAADRGVGGTGSTVGGPSGSQGQDRGIGGTGVVGTVRGFGSIIVNDLRVTFPPGVSVRIDGRSATIRNVRLGHVVSLLAHRRRGVFSTRSIEVRSEIIGPVDKVSDQLAEVLGQRVELEASVAPRLRVGETVAVSGLRRPDGTVMASLVEARPGAPLLLRGTVAAEPDGTFRIGRLRIAGIGSALEGRRVSLEGVRIGDEFKPSKLSAEPETPFSNARHVSIESYIIRGARDIRLDAGLSLPAHRLSEAELRPGATTRAIVVATRAPDGRLALDAVKVERTGPTTSRGERPRGPFATPPRSDKPKGQFGAAVKSQGSGRVGAGKGSGPGGSRGSGR